MTHSRQLPIRSIIRTFCLLIFALATLIGFNRYPPQRIVNKIRQEGPQAYVDLKREIKFALEPAIPVENPETIIYTYLPLIKNSNDGGPLYVNPANPRYFTDGSGKAILLSGSHTWLNLQDGVYPDPPPAFNYAKWLDFLVEHNHNFFRLWTWEQAKWVNESSDDYYFSPLPYERTGPGLALDGKPKFDLQRFNETYFDRLRQRVIAAKEKNIYVSIMLFNGWSIQTKGQNNLSQPWNGHPMNVNNNINGINGDMNGNGEGEEIETLLAPDITFLQEMYVRKVIDSVNDLDNVLYEVTNEGPDNSQEWQYHMINFIKSYEKTKPKQHPVGMTVEYPNGSNEDLFDSPADWISPNGDINNPPIADGSKVIISDTDHLCGICGDRTWVWKSFTRGENPNFMDQYDDSYKLEGGGYDLNNPNDVSLRENLGYIQNFSNRIKLVKLHPLPDLASSGYCLANPDTNDAEYLIYIPIGGKVTVDLSGVQGELSIEWFNPSTGETTYAGKISTGGNRSFNAPFSGDSVLYIYKN